MSIKLKPKSFRTTNSYNVNSKPNIIPFVDIMLVLLIIFMVAAPIATVDINAKLPWTMVIPSKRPANPIYVTIQDRGGDVKYYVGNDLIQGDDLGKVAFSRLASRKNAAASEVVKERIYIRADAKTPYYNVVYAMNRLQDAGFYKIALVGEDKRK